MKPFAFLLLLFVFAACDSSDVLEGSTYPPPGSYTALAVSDLFTAPAGRYNVEAYVASISECAPDMVCFVPDNLTIVESLATDPRPVSVMIFAEKPSQFTLNGFYIFSVEVTGEPEMNRGVTLLGYDNAERLE